MIRLLCNLSRLASLAALALIGAQAGCGDRGPPRTDIWGDVVWNGQKVSRGVIYFDPDVSKGNQGPQGFALIIDGKYDTRAARSKGCITGPHLAFIHGYNGQGITKFQPYGGELFAPQQLPIAIPREGGQLDLAVPASVPPAPKATEPGLE